VVVVVEVSTGLREEWEAGLQEALVDRQLAGLNLREEPHLWEELLVRLFKAATQHSMVDQVEVGFLEVEVVLMAIIILEVLEVLGLAALDLLGEPLLLPIKALGQHRR